MASFHNWTGDEEIDTQVPQFLNEDNTATLEKLDTKFNKSLEIAEASDLNNFKDEGFYCCNLNSRAETILNCPTNYAFGLMVWGKGEIVYQEVREYNSGSKNRDNNNCWRRSYYSSSAVQNAWSNWQQVAYTATTLAGYGITDGMRKDYTNRVSVEDIVQMDVNTKYLSILGGNRFDKCASFQLYGGEAAANTGQFVLRARDLAHSVEFFGNPSGVLKWGNKNIVRSVNNSVADDNGNVNIVVDATLSETSPNPVQNKTITNALADYVKQGTPTNLISYGNEFNFIPKGGTPNGSNWIVINYRFGKGAATADEKIAGYTFGNGTGNSSTNLASIKAKGFIGNATSATKATQDGDGNVISTTYAKISAANTWEEQQDFKYAKLWYEKYLSPKVSGTSNTPSLSVMHYVATGAFTLDLSILSTKLQINESTVFTAYITSAADYPLTITKAGTIKYIGSASDVAITSAGLLLNILMTKDEDGNVTSIVQASKLEGGA